jgi:tetratricopeptide (TPR) repeat protein
LLTLGLQQLIERRDYEGALALVRERLRVDPADAAALSGLGAIHLLRKDYPAALRELRHAVRAAPALASAWGNLGSACLCAGDPRRAVGYLRRAQRLSGGTSFSGEYAAGCRWRAAELRRVGRRMSAVRMLAASLRAEPDAASWSDLGTLYASLGRGPAAERCFRRAIQLEPGDAQFRSNLAISLLFRPDLSPEQVAQGHRDLFAELPRQATAALRRGGGPLRIGYFSADFRLRPLAFFLPSLLRHRNCEEFVTFWYSNTHREDEHTAGMKGMTDYWRNIRDLDDPAAATAIRADGIDILVDCAGHFEGGRPGLFALSPAPVQVALLGYPCTSGVPGIGWRIVDAVTDPPGETDHLHTETLVRLRGPYACYAPPADCPEVAVLPAKRNGYVTFGCVQKREKITLRTLEVWAAVLKRVPESRLTFHHYFGRSEGAAREFRAPIERIFERRGVSRERLGWISGLPHYDHLRALSEFDIALDTYPFNGMVTTCDCLWMGVPVVTRAGAAHVGRVGASFLARIGAGDWVVGSDDEFLEIAAALASDLQALERIRKGLRSHMRASDLMDGNAYAAEVESALRDIWRRSSVRGES